MIARHKPAAVILASAAAMSLEIIALPHGAAMVAALLLTAIPWLWAFARVGTG